MRLWPRELVHEVMPYAVRIHQPTAKRRPTTHREVMLSSSPAQLRPQTEPICVKPSPGHEFPLRRASRSAISWHFRQCQQFTTPGSADYPAGPTGGRVTIDDVTRFPSRNLMGWIGLRWGPVESVTRRRGDDLATRNMTSMIAGAVAVAASSALGALRSGMTQ